MKPNLLCRLSVCVFSFWVLTAFIFMSVEAAPETAGVIFKTISGNVDYSTQPGQWQPLQLDSKVSSGAVIRTRESSTVDFYLHDSKTTLRLTPNSKLTIDTLKSWNTGEQDVTDTQLKLLEGGIVGVQNKLVKPSHFQIIMPNGVATIVGTEYLVRADGAVTVLSGSVSVNYNLPGNKGSVKVDVPTGYSFDPATGKVVPTTPAYLKSIIADVNTVKHNAEVYKAGGATVVVKPEKFISPVCGGNGNGNGQEGGDNEHGNNGVGNGIDPQPPGNPPVNDGSGTSPGIPGNKGGSKK